MKRFVGFALALVIFSALIFASCEENKPESSAPAVSEFSSEKTAESRAETSPEESEELPVLILEYDEYLVAKAERDGFSYRYTYCFDENDLVFNAEARIVFPDEKSAAEEYKQLKEKEYPNLLLEGNVLTFAFPKKECPYYQISFEVLPYLLETTIYEITEICPRPAECSEETSF